MHGHRTAPPIFFAIVRGITTARLALSSIFRPDGSADVALLRRCHTQL
jgi:hypothetical protein